MIYLFILRRLQTFCMCPKCLDMKCFFDFDDKENISTVAEEDNVCFYHCILVGWLVGLCAEIHKKLWINFNQTW